MIKLIGTDIDGTLLDSEKNLPENFGDIVNKLFEKGIHFCIASGRSYAALGQMFGEYKDKLTFICDNGAYVMDRGELVSMSLIERPTVRAIAEFCQNSKSLTPILCGVHGTWYSDSGQASHKEIAQYYNNRSYIKNLSECDDDIFKIAVFDENGIEHGGYPKLAESFGEKLNVQISGNFWCDIMNKGISKGSAMKALQQRLNISFNETMAFGDYLNDISLLEQAYYSFAVSNAHPQLKAAANFQTGSNDENSVMKEIIKYCNI